MLNEVTRLTKGDFRNVTKDKLKYKTCESCKGDGEFEISAGTHSFFQECKTCNGTGRIKK